MRGGLGGQREEIIGWLFSGRVPDDNIHLWLMDDILGEYTTRRIGIRR